MFVSGQMRGLAFAYRGAIIRVVGELPSGTVTLLFTDVEGSTRLLQELGRDRYVEALEVHRRLLREAFTSHGGVEVEMQGDSFHFAFASAREAVLAAAEGQRALASHDWESEPIRVRIGIHTGEPLLADQLYAGLDVHRAARVMAAGHGGQVLLSDATQRQLDSDVALVDLGEHRLKDLLQPERLYQLQIEGLPSEFPALKTLGNRPTNLPMQPNALIGRERELREIVGLLRREEVRLLSLTGTGGTGKTRLGLQAGAELLEDFRSGVFFVSLAPIRDSNLVLPTIAQALSLREVPGEELPDTLAAYLEEKELLLLLDNFEQVVEAAGTVGDLLSRCARLKALVTSRERLRIPAERVYEVPPLELPERTDDLELLAQSEAVALFVARARAATSDFELAAENAGAVAEVCERLEGLPLAIELAAARIRLLPPASLVRRLHERLELLTTGARGADERQQTLRKTIGWSYDLLNRPEQILFARLSVFVGGCRIEATEGVCDPDGDLGLDLLDGLESLLEKSLLRRRQDVDAEPRFWMLETIREYALERLNETNEAAAVRLHHARVCAAFAESAAPRLRGSEQAEWLERVAGEEANIRAALEWSLTHERETALRVVAGLWRYWWARGRFNEGRSWLESALTNVAEAPPVPRFWALLGAGALARAQGDYERAEILTAESLALARGLGGKWLTASATHNLATISYDLGDLARAKSRFEESLALRREVGDAVGVAQDLGALAGFAADEGDSERARALYGESLELARELGDRESVAMTLANLAELILQDDPARARTQLLESLALSGELQHAEGICGALETLANLEAGAGRACEAVVLFGAADQRRKTIGSTQPAAEREKCQRTLAGLRATVSEGEFARAWAQGQAMSGDQAVEFALTPIAEALTP